MKKKLVSVLFGIAFAFALAIPTFAAQGATVCTPEQTKCARGETVTFAVSAAEPITDRVFAVNLWEKGKETVAYAWDSEVFELIGGEWLITPDQTAGMNIKDFDVEKGAAVLLCENEITLSGDLFRFSLRVKDDAPFGTYTVAPAIQFEGADQLEVRQEAQIQVFHECRGEYQYDDTHHWLECVVEGCTEEPEKSEHRYDNECDDTCDCGKTRTVTHDYKAASDTNHHWMECSICHTTKEVEEHSFSPATDAANHWMECSKCHTAKDVAEHQYSADCDPDCNDCGFTRTPPAQHSYLAACATGCTACGLTRADTPDHTYDSDQDTDCNLCGEIRQTYKVGDLNGDNLVTDADAVYLLMHSYFAQMYPVNQNCDLNRDNLVTDADAVYLLMYTYFPDMYPIN